MLIFQSNYLFWSYSGHACFFIFRQMSAIQDVKVEKSLFSAVCYYQIANLYVINSDSFSDKRCVLNMSSCSKSIGPFGLFPSLKIITHLGSSWTDTLTKAPVLYTPRTFWCYLIALLTNDFLAVPTIYLHKIENYIRCFSCLTY